MSDAELKIIRDGLKDLENLYGNSSCNDLYLDDSEENRAIVREYQVYCGESEELNFHKGKIITFDTIQSYLIRRELDCYEQFAQ